MMVFQPFHLFNLRAFIALILYLFCQLLVAEPFVDNSLRDTISNVEPIKVIPTDLKFNSEIVQLGKRLFHDNRLSKDNTVSCATCHPLENAGTDGLPVSIGINGLKGQRNSPSIFNSGFNFRQFWDGRARTLEDQVVFPVTNPVELGSNWSDVMTKLNKDHQYVNDFQHLYPEDGLTIENIKHAIATFERSLSTPNSDFDKYLNGEQDAISEQAKRGYKLFKFVGCTSCHNGINVGGNMYEKLGIIFPYYIPPYKLATSDEDETPDYGRFEFTQKERDRFSFKVPSLRNIALTSPYFHDGSITSLYTAVKLMSIYQLGKNLSNQEIKDIVAFLKTLTGERFKALQSITNSEDSVSK